MPYAPKLRWSTPDGLATLVKTNPEYVAKHLKGQHDQKDHGKWVKQLTGGMSADQKRKIINSLQGESLEESMTNANKWLMQRGKTSQIEYGVLIDDGGAIRDVLIGRKGSVIIPGVREPGLMGWLKAKNTRGMHITHLHPFSERADRIGLKPLSGGDVVAAILSGNKSITAVTPQGAESTLRIEVPESRKARRKQAREAFKAVDEFENMTGQWAGFETGETGIRAAREMMGRMKEFGEKSKKEQVRLAGRVSRKADDHWNERLNKIEGLTYTSTISKSRGEVGKHLIGHHKQKDHDPTKEGHSRAQHKEMARPNVERAGLYGTLGALSGAMALKKGSTPLTRGLYGLYALNFAIGAADAAATARSVSKVKDEALGDVLEKLSRVSGVRPEQVLEDLGEYMMSNKITHPTKDDIHEFMVKSYGDEVAKHLIGGHQQKDHDPTKNGKRTHTRSQHGKLQQAVQRGSKEAVETYYPSGHLQGATVDATALGLAATGAVMAPAWAGAGRQWHRMARAGGKSGRAYPVPVRRQTIQNIKQTRQQAQSSLDEARQRFQQYMSGAGKTTVVQDIPGNPVWAGRTGSPFLPARRQ